MDRRTIAASFLAACGLCVVIVGAFLTLLPEPPAWALWVLTIAVTFLVSRYQRRTGPGYNIPASCEIGGAQVTTHLSTSFAREGDCPVRLSTLPDDARADLLYRRFPTGEAWSTVPFVAEGEGAVAHIPHQPPAGKVEYHVELTAQAGRCALPKRDNVIVRFRGSVSAGVLVPHVLLMLAAMILSARGGLEAWYGGSAQVTYAALTLAALVGGGMIFGPLVQKAAFGKYWTGIPFGHDLTDNKTLIAVVAWATALIASAAGWESASTVQAGAGALCLVAFLIPHSLFGSELTYND